MTIFNEIDNAIQGRGHEVARALGAIESEKTSGMFRCASPDHNDRNPSMNVCNRTALGYCFSCGAKFNIISMAKALGHANALEKVSSILHIKYVKGGKRYGRK